MKKENRLWIRINSDDLDKLNKDSKDLNLTKSQLLRLYINNKKLSTTLATLNKSIEFNNLMLHQISRIATNINQIAYNLNANKTNNIDSINAFSKEAQDTKEIFKEISKTYKISNQKLLTLYKS